MNIKYAADAWNYKIQEAKASKKVVHAGMTYTNSKGKKYKVIETSSVGELDVLVATTCPFGVCNIWIPKILLFI